MKRRLLTIVSVLLIAGAGIYLFRAQLWEVTKNAITKDMFIAADTDSFDPGLPVGSHFPAIKAIYQGSEITSVDQFVHDKGMVFIANRSANW